MFLFSETMGDTWDFPNMRIKTPLPSTWESMQCLYTEIWQYISELGLTAHEASLDNPSTWVRKQGQVFLLLSKELK